MSDNFVNTLVKMEAGEFIVYHASSPESATKVEDFVLSFSSKQFSVDVIKQGRHRKLTITRIQ